MEKIMVIRNEYEKATKTRILEYEFNGKIFTTVSEYDLLNTKEFETREDADEYLKIVFTRFGDFETRKITKTVMGIIALAMAKLRLDKESDEFDSISMIYRYTTHKIENGNGSIFKLARNILNTAF